MTSDTQAKLVVDLKQVVYRTVEGIVHGDPFDLDKKFLNTVKCHNLNASTFLINIDLNVTATCPMVEFSRDKLFSLHVSLCFWLFLLQNHSEERIQTVSTINMDSYEETTCVRIA